VADVLQTKRLMKKRLKSQCWWLNRCPQNNCKRPKTQQVLNLHRLLTNHIFLTCQHR